MNVTTTQNLYCVITSVGLPNAAMRSWQECCEVLVVPDRKTSSEPYLYEDIRLLPLELHHGLSRLPWNHYSRKMIGYLEAYSLGADVILDTDDDTFKTPMRGPNDHHTFGVRHLRSESTFVNVFAQRLTSEQAFWPRGLPLRAIHDPVQVDTTRAPEKALGVLQMLIDGDTDVDAVHRLVFGVSEVQFHRNTTIDVIPGDYFCPFNSQLTLWSREVFPLMYLPTTVSFRFTDILRGVVAKRILDAHGIAMGFTDSIGYQVRNPHDFSDDFRSEVSCYLQTELAWSSLSDLRGQSLTDDLQEAYRRLVSLDICQQVELEVLHQWTAAFSD